MSENRSENVNETESECLATNVCTNVTNQCVNLKCADDTVEFMHLTQPIPSHMIDLTVAWSIPAVRSLQANLALH